MINLTSFQIKRFVEKVRGGEAIIYEDPQNPDILYRIYIDYETSDLSLIEVKTKYFIGIKKQLPKEIVGPEDIVYVDGQFAGNTMKAIVNGVDIDLLIDAKFAAINNVNNKHCLMVVDKVNQIFRKLHQIGILVGDVSSGNIMIDIASIVNKNIPKVYFIDIVSWGVRGKFPPSTYTKAFTCPDSYLPDGKIEYSLKNENYALAVLNFLILATIHPFGGIYKPKPRMRPSERMKRKLSILGPARQNGDIGINDNIPSYDWMSPELKQHFLEIFEQDRRDDVFIDDVETLYGNLKYCNVHGVYYDARFDQCPICNNKAMIHQIPTNVTIQAATSGGDIVATCVFAPNDCNIILNKYMYISKDRYFVHKRTGRKIQIEIGMKTEFSKDGRFAFISDENQIQIINSLSGDQIAVLPCAFKSMNMVSGEYFYYVDPSNALQKVKPTLSGIITEFVAYVRKPIFEVTEDGQYCIVSRYPGKAMVDVNSYRFDIKCPAYIKEFAIKRDNSSKTPQWLFVYKDEKGDEYHTWLLKDNKVALEELIGYDYTVDNLSNICINRGIIYIPDEDKITGISTNSGKTKEFKCNVPGIITRNSKLEFTGNGFHVTNRDKEYNLM